jgi:hypothetical protein
MSLFTRVRSAANTMLAPLNMRTITLTAERAELKRLSGLEAAGRFEKPIFPVLKEFGDCNPSPLLAEVTKYQEIFGKFALAPRDGAQFSLDNDYFTSPDAEILYATVRRCQPLNIVEVGSGNSTLLFREAINDGQLNTRLVSIDPHPRREIARNSDEIILERVEHLSDLKRFAKLKANDILFIDSSHEIKTGNDVLFLFLQVLPSLLPGVLIHIHDIFLPYEYPRQWVVEKKWNWTEQYLIQALLQGSGKYDVLWPGHYLQRKLSDFNEQFVHWRGASAKSLWLHKR